MPTAGHGGKNSSLNFAVFCMLRNRPAIWFSTVGVFLEVISGQEQRVSPSIYLQFVSRGDRRVSPSIYLDGYSLIG